MNADSIPRLRIARIIARLNVGGPTRHVVWLTARLPPEEFETVLVTGTIPPGEDDMSDFAAAHGVRPFVIPEMSREIAPRDLIAVWKLYRFFRRFRPDIIHTHTAKAGTVGRLAGLLYRWLTPSTLLGRPRRVRLVHTFHGHVFHSYYGGLRSRLFLAIEQLLAAFTDAIITLSERQRIEIHERFRVGRRGRIHVVPLGVEMADAPADPASPPHGFFSGDIVVSVIGRLVPVKNHHLFLRVASARNWPAAVRFVIFGNGPERAALERSVESHGLTRRVSFAGIRPIEEIYALTSIVALTSLNEGTPLAIIEAMTRAIPVISTSVGGVDDLLGPLQERVIEGEAVYERRVRGISVASGQALSFAAGLERILRDPSLRQEITMAGRAFVRSAHSMDRLVAEVAALYRDILERPRT